MLTSLAKCCRWVSDRITEYSTKQKYDSLWIDLIPAPSSPWGREVTTDVRPGALPGGGKRIPRFRAKTGTGAG